MKRKMSWTPTPSHLMKQMPRKRGPRHKGLESTKWNDEISYLGSEKLMSFWAIFLVLHFASLICGNPLFGCYKGGNIRRYTSYHVDTSYHRGTPDHISSNLIASMKKKFPTQLDCRFKLAHRISRRCVNVFSYTKKKNL